MKRHVSVFMLFVRGSVYKVLVVLAAMVLAESVLVFAVLKDWLEAEAQNALDTYALNSLVTESEIVWVFFAAFLLITLILCLFGCDRNGKLEYTIQRLGISPISIFFWQAACNALMYVLLWLVQLYAAFGFGLYYLKVADPSWVTNQTLFLEFHRSDFLFSLLPMENGGCYVLNIIMVLCLGIVTARVPHCQRKKHIPIAIFVMLGLMLLIWPQGVGEGAAIAVLISVSILIAGMSILSVYLAEPGFED